MGGGEPVDGFWSTFAGEQSGNVLGIERMPKTAAISRPEVVVVNLNVRTTAKDLTVYRAVRRGRHRLHGIRRKLGGHSGAIAGADVEYGRKLMEEALLEIIAETIMIQVSAAGKSGAGEQNK